MEQIKDIVRDVIQGILKKQEENPGGDIEQNWTRSATKKILQHTKFRNFTKGNLYINVENSAWLYELRQKKPVLLKKIQKLSKNKIIDIKFKVGDIHGN